MNQQMHVLGGYGEQRVDRAYHHVYDPRQDRWFDAPALPRGANHVGVAVLGDQLYAVGGHLEQNRNPDSRFFLENTHWREIAPFPQRCGAVALVALGRNIHAIGGAIGDTFSEKKVSLLALYVCPRSGSLGIVSAITHRERSHGNVSSKRLDTRSWGPGGQLSYDFKSPPFLGCEN